MNLRGAFALCYVTGYYSFGAIHSSQEQPILLSPLN